MHLQNGQETQIALRAAMQCSGGRMIFLYNQEGPLKSFIKDVYS